MSSNLNFSLYRSSDNKLYFHRREPGKTLKIWDTDERFRMNQVAISPSGRFVAYASEEEQFIEVVDTESGGRIREVLNDKVKASDASIAWSKDDTKFYVNNLMNGAAVVTVGETKLHAKTLPPDSSLELAVLYGRVPSKGTWGSNADWGPLFSHDECNGMAAFCLGGLGSSLRIHSQEEETKKNKLTFSLTVTPGLLRLAAFSFREVAFLPGCRECLFDAEGYIYLLDTEQSRVGTFSPGERFCLLTPRYQKTL